MENMEISDVLSVWEHHRSVNEYLLANLSEDQLSAAVPGEDRTIGYAWSYIHHVRLMWLKVSAVNLIAPIGKMETGRLWDRAYIGRHLKESGDGIASLLEGAEESGRITGFSYPATMFPSYLIAQEAHIRGKMVAQLTAIDKPISADVEHQMWDWKNKARR
ncbi:hypothetical protein [Pontibacter sp. G13]|uniref:hypothetical protein n=1 Tax=Pontibacter sp. G13 TaxID=3074898 RepID=UPI00288C3267|nr:hypothetical protein [Pontibacter sp. G13]WNJ19603.1 hypothetical protein RJD25_03870 [Pontibacter sp. G13]